MMSTPAERELEKKYIICSSRSTALLYLHLFSILAIWNDKQILHITIGTKVGTEYHLQSASLPVLHIKDFHVFMPI